MLLSSVHVFRANTKPYTRRHFSSTRQCTKEAPILPTIQFLENILFNLCEHLRFVASIDHQLPDHVVGASETYLFCIFKCPGDIVGAAPGCGLSGLWLAVFWFLPPESPPLSFINPMLLLYSLHLSTQACLFWKGCLGGLKYLHNSTIPTWAIKSIFFVVWTWSVPD